MSSLVTTSIRPGIALNVTLNNPKRANCLNSVLIDELTRVFSQSHNVRAIFLTANGKTFCSGADIKELARIKTKAEALKMGTKLYNMYKAIITTDVPIISIVSGRVCGGGVGLLAASDALICPFDSSVRLTETKLGFIPALVSAFLPSSGSFFAVTGRNCAKLFGDKILPLPFQQSRKAGCFEGKENSNGKTPKGLLSNGDNESMKIENDDGIDQVEKIKAVKQLCQEITDELSKSPIAAIKATKRLFISKVHFPSSLINTFATQLLSDEAQKGLTEFIKKQKAKKSK